MTTRVVILQETLPHDRVPLFEQVRDRAADRRIAVASPSHRCTARTRVDRQLACYLGPVQGDDCAGPLASARLLLVPGMAGLVVLDSFVAGGPPVFGADHPAKAHGIDQAAERFTSGIESALRYTAVA